MDLVRQVMTTLAIDESRAEKGIGAILMSLRALVDKPTFEKVKAAVPNSERYMGHSLMSAARTGEITGMVGPAALLAALAAAGIAKDDIPRLGRLVVEYLRPTIGKGAVEKLYAMAPALKG